MSGQNTNKGNGIREAFAILLVIIVVLLAVSSEAVPSKSKRSVFVSGSSYVMAPPEILVGYSLTENQASDPLLYYTLAVTASRDVDIHIEYRGYQDNLGYPLLGTDPNDIAATAYGGYVNDIWGWTTAEYFDDTYVATVPDEVISYYNYGGMTEWRSYGDCHFEVRFKLRYENDDGDIVTSNWYRPTPIFHTKLVGSDTPEILDPGVPDVVAWEFFGYKTVVSIDDVEISDGLDGDKLAISWKLVSRLNGTEYQKSVEYLTFGDGTYTDLGIVRMYESISEMVSDGDHLWDYKFRVIDNDGNELNWVTVDVIDMRDHD